MAFSPTPTLASPAPPAHSYAGPLAAMTALFFLFGAVTNFNDVLMPYLKDVCQLSDLATSAVQFAFFGAYFLMSLPAGWLLRRLGYKRGIVAGLLVMAGGALLFVPAANARAFSLFLLGLSLLGAGVTLLQVAANPYVSVLGPPRLAASRVSIVGVANGLGGTLSPLLGGLLLFGGSAVAKAQLAALPAAERLTRESALVKTPYLGLALFLAVLAGVFALLRLPEIDALEADDQPEARHGRSAARTSALAYPHLVLGIGAIFFYVGVEVGIGSFLIRYGEAQGILTLSPFTQALVRGLNVATNFVGVLLGQSPAAIDTTAGFTKAVGAVLVSSYWFGLLVGRVVGIPVLRRLPSRPLLVAVCAAGLVLVLASVTLHGEAALWLLVACGLCNAIMWPVIFPLAITGLGAHTKQGSSYLIMAIVGGALIPPLMGLVSSYGGGLRVAFLLPALCYVYLLFYAVRGYRVR